MHKNIWILLTKSILRIIQNLRSILGKLLLGKNETQNTHTFFGAFFEEVPKYWQQKPSGIRLGRSLFLPLIKILRSYESPRK